MMVAIDTVKVLGPANMNQLAAVYRLHGEPLPTSNVMALVVERDGRPIASMTFHSVTILGLTHSQDDEAMRLLEAAVAAQFGAGEHLFTVVNNDWGRMEAEMAGMVAVEGQLMRKDF